MGTKPKDTKASSDEANDPFSQAKRLTEMMKKAGHPISFSEAYEEALALAAEKNREKETVEV